MVVPVTVASETTLLFTVIATFDGFPTTVIGFISSDDDIAFFEGTPATTTSCRSGLTTIVFVNGFPATVTSLISPVVDKAFFEGVPITVTSASLGFTTFAGTSVTVTSFASAGSSTSDMDSVVTRTSFSLPGGNGGAAGSFPYFFSMLAISFLFSRL